MDNVEKGTEVEEIYSKKYLLDIKEKHIKELKSKDLETYNNFVNNSKNIYKNIVDLAIDNYKEYPFENIFSFEIPFIMKRDFNMELNLDVMDLELVYDTTTVYVLNLNYIRDKFPDSKLSVQEVLYSKNLVSCYLTFLLND